MKKMIIDNENPNGITVDLTAEEIAEVNTLKAAILTQTTEEEAEITAKTSAQVSGNTKLLGLGLTQAEATALTGYSIPVEE